MLFGEVDCTSDLEARLSAIFREQSHVIFNFSEEQISRFILDKYR